MDLKYQSTTELK